jgi:hypothetical protein
MEDDLHGIKPATAINAVEELMTFDGKDTPRRLKDWLLETALQKGIDPDHRDGFSVFYYFLCELEKDIYPNDRNDE